MGLFGCPSRCGTCLHLLCGAGSLCPDQPRGGVGDVAVPEAARAGGFGGKIQGPHQARHDLARRLLSGDEGTKMPVPLADAAAILAHADVRITAGIYARPSKESPAKALERIVGEDQ